MARPRFAFDFGHDLRDATIGQRIILAEPAETLCLRKGRCKLIAGHDFAQNFLLVIVEIGKLHRGSQCDPSLIYQFQNFGNEIGKADVTKHLDFAVVSAFPDFTGCIKLRTNLVRS